MVEGSFGVDVDVFGKGVPDGSVDDLAHDFKFHGVCKCC